MHRMHRIQRMQNMREMGRIKREVRWWEMAMIVWNLHYQVEWHLKVGLMRWCTL